jgi:hypothetical protein
VHRKQQKTLLFFIYIIINPATIKSCDRTKRLYAGRRTDSRAERRTELDDGFLASHRKEKLGRKTSLGLGPLTIVDSSILHKSLMAWTTTDPACSKIPGNFSRIFVTCVMHLRSTSVGSDAASCS